jgi:type VI secretion system secreted protein Hcp
MKDIYLKFEGGSTTIVGESRDPEHKDCIEAHSWSHLIRQPKSATASTSGGHTAERCEHGDMIFTKDIDQASPAFWLACSAGIFYKKVTIDFMRAAGDKRVRYLQITLNNVIVSSVESSVKGDGLPIETFGLTYASVKWEYSVQNLEGKSTGSKTAMWSLSQNKATDGI